MEVKDLTYEDLKKAKRKRPLTEEEKERWNDLKKEVVKESKRRYYQKTKERDRDRRKIYEKQYRVENRDKRKEYEKQYRAENLEKRKTYEKEWYQINQVRYRKNQKISRLKLKFDALVILGGCECVICKDKNIHHLTIDHINSNGGNDRKIGLITTRLHRAIVKGELPQEQLENLRVLCWNHNSSRTREYLNLPKNEQTQKQKYITKLWKEAFDFFGPCSCGISELKFLTISHLRNDGAKRRKNGEKSGPDLLQKFRNAKWPETLKEDFCLECWNCNCSRLAKDPPRKFKTISPSNSAGNPD